MVKVNLNSLESLSEEETKKETERYKNRGFSWVEFGFPCGGSYQISTPKFVDGDSIIIDYFRNLKKLEFGNKEQIEMLKALNLVCFLDNRKKYQYLNIEG